MATSVATFEGEFASAERAPSVPWTIWAGVAAVTSSTIGGAWDVSWHRSIGRDTFFTPAHMMIYACGVIAALLCAYLIFYTTFGRSSAMKSESVSVLGFRAPLGAFIAAWGGIAMLTSAPFDNWWHNAYGLDVKIISPPHTLLIFGIRCVAIGVVFLLVARMNRVEATFVGQPAARAADSTYNTLQTLFLYMGGLSLIGQMFFIQEMTWDAVLHQSTAYAAMAVAVPVIFGFVWQISGNRWACSITALVYMAAIIAEILILPLVPATPKLGPVFYPVTHMIPGKFPALLIAPALAVDLLMQRIKGWKSWQIGLAVGLVFVAVLTAVEWPFAQFLMSKASENWFFGSGYHAYYERPRSLDVMRRFANPDSGAKLFVGLAWASVYAAISMWAGLLFGQWMRGVKR